MKKITLITLILLVLTCKSDGKNNKLLLGLLALLPGNSSSGGSVPPTTTSTPANPSDQAYANGNSNTSPTDYDYITYGVPVYNPPVVIPPPVAPNPNDTYTLVPFVPGTISARVLKPLIGVDRFQDIVIEFSEPMQLNTICPEGSDNVPAKISLKNAANGVEIIGKCFWKTTSQLLFDPLTPMDANVEYRVTITTSAQTLTNLPFGQFANPDSPVNSTKFKTEPGFGTTVNIQRGAENYNVTQNRGANFSEPNPSSPTNVNLITNLPDVSQATNVYIYNLRDTSQRYTVCSSSGTSCSSLSANLPVLNLTSISPSSLKLDSTNVGLQQYYYQIEYQITTTPVQFKRYYRAFSFNWGLHSNSPKLAQQNTGRVVIEKGRGARVGTLDVLAKFLNDYADKRFSIRTANGDEFLYDIMKRGSHSVNTGYGSCENWSNKNVLWLPQTIIGYAYPVSQLSNYDPFVYYTNIGPFCGFDRTQDLDICIDTFLGRICSSDSNLTARTHYIADIFINEATVGFNESNASVWVDQLDTTLNPPRIIDRTFDGTNYQPGAVRVGLDLIAPPTGPVSIPSDYNLKVSMDVQKMRANLKAVIFIDSLSIVYKLNLLFTTVDITIFQISWLGISTLTLVAGLDANLDMGSGYTLTNMHAKATVDSSNNLVLSMFNYVDGSINTVNPNEKFYGPGWVNDMKILNPSSLQGLSLFPSYNAPPDTCLNLTWDSGQNRYEDSNGSPPPNQPPRNAASDLSASYPAYRNWNTFTIQTGTGPGPAFTPIYSTFWQPTQFCQQQGGSFAPGLTGFAAWLFSPIKNIVNNVVTQIVPAVKPNLITQMLKNFVEKVASTIFNGVLEPLKKGVELSMPPILPMPIGSSTNTIVSNEGMDLKLGLALSTNSVNISKQDPNGAKGLETSVNLKLLLNNKSLTGSADPITGASKSCNQVSDVNQGKCPPTPNGSDSFVLTKNPTLELPYILDLEKDKPGVMLGLHSDIIGQFFYSFWKEGGLNMKINQTFINRLLTYRTKTRPIELLEILLKAQSLLQVIAPGKTSLTVKNVNTNAITVIQGTDNLEIRLRPLQTPFVFLNGATNSYPAPGQPGFYIPKLGVSLSDVEVEIVGNPGPSEYRIAVLRLNLKTNARMWTAPYSNPSDPVYGNRLSVRLDICNDFDDAALDSSIGNKDCDYDTPADVNLFGNHLVRPESKDLTYSVVVFDDAIRNPFSLSSNNIVELINPIVGSVLIPIFNFTLGEIPLPALSHCGINISNNISVVGIPTSFSPSDPVKKPMILLNGFNSATLTPFPVVGGNCNLTTPN